MFYFFHDFVELLLLVSWCLFWSHENWLHYILDENKIYSFILGYDIRKANRKTHTRNKVISLIYTFLQTSIKLKTANDNEKKNLFFLIVFYEQKISGETFSFRLDFILILLMLFITFLLNFVCYNAMKKMTENKVGHDYRCLSIEFI